MRKKIWGIVIATSIIITTVFAVYFNFNTNAATTKFNYGEALQKSILFYEAQRSGSISTSSIPTRLSWRGDSQLTDGKDVGLDLTGGWVDAGDNMKYVHTMGSTASVLAWGAIEYKDAYEKSGQMKWLMNQLKWVNDFFIKAHPSANVFYGQMGMTASDHDMWIPIESSSYLTNRKSIKFDASNPGTDLIAQVASAMASSSIIFRDTDPTYADKLLTHAEQLFNMAETYKGNAVKTLEAVDPQTPYKSWSGYADELVWGSIWLYRASEAKTSGSGSTYLNKAEEYYKTLGNEQNQSVKKYKWSLVYDDHTFADYIAMAQLFPTNKTYTEDAERWLNWWTVGGTEYNADGTKVAYTAGGHARLDEWGSLRYAANASLCAFIYSDKISDSTKKARYHNFAVNQINYILGENPRKGSYMVGFGENSPQHPHHRTAHGSWCQRQNNPSEHRHILYGALVGSPTTSDGYNDKIDDYVANEVAIDYNSGLTGCLARMYSEFGGSPVADSNLVDKPHTAKDEWPVFILTYFDGAGGLNPVILVENRTSWPARNSNKLSVRYFFTLDSNNISDISIKTDFAGAKIKGPTLWNASDKIYYFEIDFTGINIFPGYAWDLGGPDVKLDVKSASGTWNSSNDWSYQKWDSTFKIGDRKYAPNIPVYENGVKLCGEEPPGGPSNTIIPSTIPPTTTITTTSPTIIYGDLNNDKKISSSDSALITRQILGISDFTESQIKIADLNGDLKITSTDVALVERYILGKIEVFPVQN